jgi:hypothetical protein
VFLQCSKALAMDASVITAISSAVIALCALAVSICQVRQSIRYKKLSVRPHLAAWNDLRPDVGIYRSYLMNNGLGPAIIESFTVRVDGQQIVGVGTEPIEKGIRLIFGEQCQLQSSYVNKGYVMAAKDSCLLLELKFDGPVFPTRDGVLHAIASRGELEITYKSVFGDELFRFTSRNPATQQSNDRIGWLNLRRSP